MLSRAGLAVLALAGLIALAANGAPASLNRQVDRLDALSNALTVGGAAAAVALAIVYAVHRVRYANARSFGATLDAAAPAASLALAALMLLTIARTGPGGTISLGGLGSFSFDLSRIGSRWFMEDPRPGAPSGLGRGVFSGGESGVGRELPALLVLVLGAAAVAIVAWIARRSTARPPTPVQRPKISPRIRPVPEAAVMHEVVLDTIDELLADPDPRKAIIGAYARLLEGLGASGAPRYAYEAPLEHLQRALTLLRVRPEPVRRLIGLFEVARFSTHDLTESHREQALESLRLAAEDLASPESRSPVAVRPTGRAAVGPRRVAR